VLLSLFHDRPNSETYATRFHKEKVLERLRDLDDRFHREGLGAFDPKTDPLVRIGMESDARGKVIKNSYGVFNLSWQAQQHPEWPEKIADEIQEIQRRIRQTHNTQLRFLIWAGMGGSAEDKSMYNAAGLLRRGVRCYVLDSTDPAKLKFILEDIRRRFGLTVPEVLRSSLIVGMAMGMTSYEPVVNLEKLAALYEKHKIDSQPNFLYKTLPNSLLDQFGKKRGYQRVELQPDNDNTTAGRHSAPLTRGSLYPLALARVDLRSWIEGAFLSDEEIHTAWRLAAFLHAQGKERRDKVTLLLPKEWIGAGIWTKQNFEESLGKSEELGIKIVLECKPKLANYRSPKDPCRQRTFLAVQIKGGSSSDGRKIGLLRRAGYPTAVLTVPGRTPLSHYMQFIHYTVFGLAYLREMNFVTQPSVELYKTITNRVYAESEKAGGIEKTKAWQAMRSAERQANWRGVVTLYYDRLLIDADLNGKDAPLLYASLLRQLAGSQQVRYAELTFFGDTRYSRRGRRMRRCLERAAEKVFRARMKMPVDVYEGPAMNHSYHEMIIGHGGCFSTVVLSEKQEQIQAAGYSSDYHRAQFLATQMALQEKGRPVVAITVKDLDDSSLERLDQFFHQVANSLKGIKI
jgi:glucose-6-phosphate isomerase